ncbi:hypothetical protein UYSO10_3585 [Kosakonia radicincitans]|nr:hypothetical protein UYSO10_3585 [Kosakonia radicincitans]
MEFNQQAACQKFNMLFFKQKCYLPGVFSKTTCTLSEHMRAIAVQLLLEKQISITNIRIFNYGCMQLFFA